MEFGVSGGACKPSQQEVIFSLMCAHEYAEQRSAVSESSTYAKPAADTGANSASERSTHAGRRDCGRGAALAGSREPRGEQAAQGSSPSRLPRSPWCSDLLVKA